MTGKALTFSSDIIDEIHNHARLEYPHECCGIVTMGARKQRVHRCRNIQNRLHGEDPLRYPEDARIAYTIDRAEADRICANAKEKGEEVIAFYHSHIDGPAYFSRIDSEAQTVLGEPEFPNVVHLIVSVVRGEIRGMKCYKWDSGKGDFLLVRLS